MSNMGIWNMIHSLSILGSITSWYVISWCQHDPTQHPGCSISLKTNSQQKQDLKYRKTMVWKAGRPSPFVLLPAYSIFFLGGVNGNDLLIQLHFDKNRNPIFQQLPESKPIHLLKAFWSYYQNILAANFDIHVGMTRLMIQNAAKPTSRIYFPSPTGSIGAASFLGMPIPNSTKSVVDS